MPLPKPYPPDEIDFEDRNDLADTRKANQDGEEADEVRDRGCQGVRRRRLHAAEQSGGGPRLGPWGSAGT